MKPNSVRRHGSEICTIVCTVKNEGPFFLEWLAYHRLIGFNRFVIFSNDCTDGTHDILQALDKAGEIHHFDNSELSEDLPEDPQGRAYTRANQMEIVRESDWVMVMDGDEFFKVNVGDGTLNALFAAMPPEADAIGVQWRIFGSGGVIDFNKNLQIDSFRRAAPVDFAPSRNHLAIKTLFRPDLVQRLGVHRPVYKGTSGTEKNPLLFVNGAGNDITDLFLRGRWCMPPLYVSYALAQINHYMIRSHEVFLMKKWRGTANSSNAERINLEYFDKYNSNYDQDEGMVPWVPAVSAEIERLRREVPRIAELSDASFDLYMAKIRELSALLEKESPSEFDRLFNKKVVSDEIKSQEKRLRKLRKKLGTDNAIIRMMPPLPKASEPSAHNVAPTTTADDDSIEETENAEPPVTAAPVWLTDLRGNPPARGFYHSFEATGVHYVDRGSDTLIVSFDNLSSVNANQVDRESWGYGFIRKGGWSHLGVFAYQPTWFRDHELIDFLQDLAERGLFKKFKKVVMIGTSMGAYAATAFAPLAPGCSVVSFSPQSTLDNALVPWEERFRSGRKADWSGPLSDGAEGAKSAGKVWLIYDPALEGDRRHADRYQGDNIIKLKARYADHKTALFLRRAEILSSVMRAAIADTLDEASFYTLYRKSRQLPWYLNMAASHIAKSSNPGRLHRYEKYLKSIDKNTVVRSLYVKFPEIMLDRKHRI